MLDLIIAIVIMIGFYFGYTRGLIKTVFDTLSVIIAILIGLRLAPFIIRILQDMLQISPALLFLVGMVIAFLIVILLLKFIARKLEALLEAANVNFVNKVAGGALQALFFAYLLSLSLWVMNNLNVLTPQVKENSITYSMLEPLPEKGKSFFISLKPIFKDFWDITLKTMNQTKEALPQQTDEIIQE
ncbi:MAG: CvpA family protein [Saprospiraceae bacterium]